MTANAIYMPKVSRKAPSDSPDFWPTPPWATHALFSCEEFVGTIWEPACGDGSMAKVIKDHCPSQLIISTDLHNRGYGADGVDFLTSFPVGFDSIDNIITNPPFNQAESFIRRADEIASRKFAFLLRLQFLEGKKRADGLWKDLPPTRVWVFPERITFKAPGAVVKNGGTTAYAWFVWDNIDPGTTKLCWLPTGMKKGEL